MRRPHVQSGWSLTAGPAKFQVRLWKIASEEVSTSSEELFAQAEQLNELIDFFQVEYSANKKVKKSIHKSHSYKPVQQQKKQKTGVELDIKDVSDTDFETF